MNSQSFVQASSQTIPYTALAVRRNLLACCGSMFWLIFWPLQKTYPHALAMLNNKALQIDFQYLLMVSMASTSLATSSSLKSRDFSVSAIISFHVSSRGNHGPRCTSGGHGLHRNSWCHRPVQSASRSDNDSSARRKLMKGAGPGGLGLT